MIGRAGWFLTGERGENPLELSLCAGRFDRFDDLVVVDIEADVVALPIGEVGERRGDHSGISPFAPWCAGAVVVEGSARVEDERDVHVRLFAEDFGVKFILPGKNFPIDIFEIVAGRVISILEEFAAGSVGKAPMDSGEVAFDGCFREKGIVINPGKGRRREKIGCGGRHSRIPSRSSRMISSERIPSASAWKLVITRWRKTGSASARTSSIATL